MPNPVYSNISGTTTGGGSGATFNIVHLLATENYSVTINNPGSGYTVGDKIVIKGRVIGGANATNDCTITVLSVSGSGVASISAKGVAASRNFVIMATDNILPGSTITYELNLNEDGPDAWKNLDNSDTIAEANDIVEWDGSRWHVVFSANEYSDTIVYQTNYYTMVQYKWNGVEWVKSFDGEYKRGKWRLVL